MVKAVQFARKFRLREELIYYDGPLLSHYTAGPVQYLVMWSDYPDDKTCLWFTVEVSIPNLKRFMANEMTLLEVMQVAPSIHRCINMFIDEVEDAHGELIAFQDIKPESLPTDKSYLRYSQP